MAETPQEAGSSKPTTSLEKLSDIYGCSEESCKLTVGMVLPNSKYSNHIAFSVRDLAEKITIAMSSKMKESDKEAAFQKADDVMARPEKVIVNPEVLKAVWKTVLSKCSHQAEEIKSMLGKRLKDEIENQDLVLEMVAHLNNVYFYAANNMDTVVVGGDNAHKIKNAINASFWRISNPDDSELRGKVIFGSKIKTILYVPNEKLLYAPGAYFDAATSIMMQTLDNLKKCNSCEVVMLPVFRHLDHEKVSQQFIAWYKETAAKDSRLLGMKEIDEMKLINWLNATPSNKDAVQFVDQHGILTELGTRKLVDYLNQLKYTWKHRELAQPETSSKTAEESTPPVPFKQMENSTDRGKANFRGNSFSRGRASSYPNRDNGRDRGVKRKVE